MNARSHGMVALLRSLLSCALLLCGFAHADCLLKPGDRMVFLGDSITEQRIYTRYVMDYFALRHSGEHIEFRNAGWVSDTAVGGVKRLQRDVLDLKPTVVSICYGMNDAGVTSYKQEIYDRYIGAMQELIDTLRAKGIRVVLLTPGCVDESRASRLAGYNATLGRFAKQLCEFAAQQGIPCYNIHEPMLETLSRAKAADPNFVMLNDGVHPNASGHMVMAYGLIKALGCVGQASQATISATTSKAACDGCKITDLKVSDDLVSFVREDHALPIYLDDSAAAAAKHFPAVEEIDTYSLKVTGLRPGKWTLSVSGGPPSASTTTWTYTSDQLAAGVDLANEPGPWKKLASEVNDISQEQEWVYYTRWRQIQLGNIPDVAAKEKQALLDKLDSYIASRETDRIANAAAPHAWQWKLELAK